MAAAVNPHLGGLDAPAAQFLHAQKPESRLGQLGRDLDPGELRGDRGGLGRELGPGGAVVGTVEFHALHAVLEVDPALHGKGGGGELEVRPEVEVVAAIRRQVEAHEGVVVAVHQEAGGLRSDVGGDDHAGKIHAAVG